MILLGRNKIGLLNDKNEIICYYRTYVFGGLNISKTSPYVNMTILCGSLKGTSLSINILNGECITNLGLRFKFLREIVTSNSKIRI